MLAKTTFTICYSTLQREVTSPLILKANSNYLVKFAKWCMLSIYDTDRHISCGIDTDDVITDTDTHTSRGIDTDDISHQFSGENDLIKDRDAASHEPCVAALGYHGEVSRVAVLEHIRHLLGRLWSQDKLATS